MLSGLFLMENGEGGQPDQPIWRSFCYAENE
jgi:hypothetical protein